MNKDKNAYSILRLFLFILLLPLINACGSGGGNAGGLSGIQITFHDTQVAGSTIARIDMTVVETQIIDAKGNKSVISTKPQSFNLLALAKNNPVVLANTTVAPGMYTQIRLILDSHTTITMSDGTTYPLKVPSGEQTGIKLNGAFNIPVGVLYTLDIDLNPGKSVIYTKGQGYELKPVIEITGSQINSGNFYYSGSYNNQAYVTSLGTDGSMQAKYAKNPQYVINGYYVFDGVAHTLQMVPQTVTCPSCSTFDQLTMSAFSDVPPPTTYTVLTFAADYIDLQDPAGTYYHVIKVPAFDLGYTVPPKVFTVNVSVPSSIGAGNVVVAQMVPQDFQGATFGGLSTIPSSLTPSFQFSIPASEFTSTSKNYVMLLAVVPSANDVQFRADGTVSSIQNVIANNNKNAWLMTVWRDQVSTSPGLIPFIPN